MFVTKEQINNASSTLFFIYFVEEGKSVILKLPCYLQGTKRTSLPFHYFSSKWLQIQFFVLPIK